jgi:hypothetical protein
MAALWDRRRREGAGLNAKAAAFEAEGDASVHYLAKGRALRRLLPEPIEKRLALNCHVQTS